MIEIAHVSDKAREERKEERENMHGAYIAGEETTKGTKRARLNPYRTIRGCRGCIAGTLCDKAAGLTKYTLTDDNRCARIVGFTKEPDM